MAVVVCFSTVIADEFHGIPLGDMLRVATCELLHAIPQGRNGRCILIQTDDKAVLLFVLLHEAERIRVDITVELNARLNAPVVLKVHHERVAEEETRLITAHMAVTLGAAVNNLLAVHFLSRFFGLVLVDPLWI